MGVAGWYRISEWDCWVLLEGDLYCIVPMSDHCNGLQHDETWCCKPLSASPGVTMAPYLVTATPCNKASSTAARELALAERSASLASDS